MDLAINGIRLMGQRHGVGRYVEYLLRHWATMEHPFATIRLYTPGEPDEPIELPARVEHHILRTRFGNTYWEQVTLARHHQPQDLLFCPSYVVPLAARGRAVVTHLGAYEAMPSAFPWHQRLRSRLAYQLSARKAELVITVSESSKANIIRFYGVRPEKIRVIPLGVDPRFQPLDDRAALRQVRQRYFGSDRPYFLFVGKLAKRRNIPELIAAFARFKRERQLPHGLLLIGQNSVGHDIPRLAREHGVSEAVVHAEFATHSDLPGIYNAADLFIYPSSYEGFGIPVLEALACGVPTIALNNSSFLEFAKGAAYLARDGSVDALYDGLQTVLCSEALRAEMRREGLRRSQNFRWESIARQTLAVLAEVAQS